MSAVDGAKEAKATKGWGGAPPPWLATLQKKIDDRKEAEKKEGEEAAAAAAGSESQDAGEEKGRFSDGEERQHPLQVRRKKKADGSESGATDTHTTPRSQPRSQPPAAAAAASTPQRSEHTQEANPELEAEGDVHAVMQNHTELARYHHQAMAHHFAMMYHHSNLAAEAYAHYMGPEHDIRQYRPDIPEMPILPDDYHMSAESQHEGPAAYGYNERGAAAAHAAAAGDVGAHYATEEEAYYYSEYGHETHETFEVPIEDDPQLTHEEQSWLNNQISDALQDHVESELKVEEELMEGMMPEMVCLNEDNPTAEEVDRFMKEVEVIEAWNKPISSVYVKEGDKDADSAKKPDAGKAEKAKE